MMHRAILQCLVVLVLLGCGERGMITIQPNAVGIGSQQRIFVATTRQPVSTSNDFTSLRSARLHFAQYNVSIPPTHIEGKIEWPGKNPDPTTDFLTTSVVPFSNAATFGAALRADQKARTADNDVIVFVHGFNNTFAESTYRLAQLSHDMENPNSTVLYSWPATQKTLEYTRDRDSVLFARDGLEKLLKQLIKDQPQDIVIVAHSIGSSLVTETLRQLSLQSDHSILRRISSVILISPDIDDDVFQTQLSRIRPLPKPFVIFGDSKDYALRISSFLTGQSARVGQLKDTESLRRFGVEFVDVSDIKDGDGALNHTVAITSPTVLSILRRFPEPGTGTRLTVDSLQGLIDKATR